MQLAVRNREELHRERGIEDFGVDPVELLIRDARDGIPARGSRRFVARALELGERLAGAAGCETAGDGEGGRALGDEEPGRACAGILLDVGRAIAKALVEALLPEVGGLGHVGVCGDDAVGGHWDPSEMMVADAGSRRALRRLYSCRSARVYSCPLLRVSVEKPV